MKPSSKRHFSHSRVRRALHLTVLIAGLSLFSAGVCANGIVYDPTNHAELVTQLNQLVKQYQQQLQQLNQAIQLTGAITGVRSMGSIANGPAEAVLRRYLPPDWQNTLKMGGATGLNSTGAQTQGLYNNLYNTYKPVSGASAITRDPSGPISQSIDHKTQTTYASMAAGEQSYNSVAPRTTTYETLLQQVDSTTDLKSSVDLQSRIAAENGLTLNELVRLHAIQVQQKAAEDNQQLTATSQSSNVNRYDASQARSAYQPGAQSAGQP